MSAPEHGSTVLGLVSRILDYMRKPWQAVVVIVILLLLGLGWLVWAERRALVAALQNRPAGAVVLKTDLLPEVNGLLNDTTADVVSVWRVDLAANVQRYLISAKRGGGAWPPDYRQLPALAETSSMAVAVKVLNGQPVCAPVAINAANLMLRLLAGDGYQRVCLVPVPSDPTAMQIGLIYLAWRRPPDAANEDAAKGAAMVAAANMVTR